jgi:hypothetical protein
MNVVIWYHCTFDYEIFGCGEVYYFNSIIITISCTLSLVYADLKMLPLPTLALKCPKFSYGIWRIYGIQIPMWLCGRMLERSMQ